MKKAISCIRDLDFFFCLFDLDVNLLPIAQEANPHCGLRHSLSKGMYFAACAIGNKLTEEEQWAKQN